MATYGLLDQREEDALHKTRLLAVDEKPYRRISRRLLAPQSLLLTPPPSPPPASSSPTSTSPQPSPSPSPYDAFRNDLLLDFSTFALSLSRMQFTLTANHLERTRYLSEKSRILSSSSSVRLSTHALRLDLETAQQTLAVRKTWDALAEKITSNRMLRPRAEQEKSLDKLRGEIEELERESEGYRGVWRERREQFGRIVEEGRGLRRLIRGEMEEVERREGMDGVDSNAATPGATSGGTPLHEPLVGGELALGGLRPVAVGQRGVTSHPSPGGMALTPAGEGEDKDVAMDGDGDDEGDDEGEIAEVDGEGEAEGEEKEEGEEDDEEEGAVKEGDGDKMDVT